MKESKLRTEYSSRKATLAANRAVLADVINEHQNAKPVAPPMPDFSEFDQQDEKAAKKKKKKKEDDKDDDEPEEETLGQKARREFAEKMVRACVRACVPACLPTYWLGTTKKRN